MISYFSLDFLEHCENHTAPEAWGRAELRVAGEREAMDAFIGDNTDRSFYGINTFPGHMDHVKLSPAQVKASQLYILRNHHIGGQAYYSQEEARAIGYCKAQHASLGGTGLSPALYAHLREALADADFAPQIPRDSSYSCGDVIPAAHWAVALVEHNGYLERHSLHAKEGMTLINGAFVHVGLALAKLRAFKRLWDAYLLADRMNAVLFGSNPSNHYVPSRVQDDPYVLACGLLESGDRQKEVQDPVSIRSGPQVVGSLGHACAEYTRTLDRGLLRQSDNPLYDAVTPGIFSQASFLDPLITLATGQLIEGWMLALWAAERRFHALLSGQSPHVPVNGAAGDDYLGFIQAPKRAMALLEHIRLMAGRRSYASGGSTSYGIEDLWSAGALTLDQADVVLKDGTEMLALETAVCVELMRRFRPELKAHHLFRLFEGKPSELRESVRFCEQVAKRHSDDAAPVWPFAPQDA